jgi:hypothetical protein
MSHSHFTECCFTSWCWHDGRRLAVSSGSTAGLVSPRWRSLLLLGKLACCFQGCQDFFVSKFAKFPQCTRVNRVFERSINGSDLAALSLKMRCNSILEVAPAIATATPKTRFKVNKFLRDGSLGLCKNSLTNQGDQKFGSKLKYIWFDNPTIFPLKAVDAGTSG